MYTVYVYSKPEQPKVFLEDSEVSLNEFNKKWSFVTLDSNGFSVAFCGKLVQYTLPTQGLYSIYRQELIELNPAENRLLLATDLDKTVYSETEEGKAAYQRFIHYWIKHYEFNGSKLVYNTGRCLSEYNKDKQHFYEPDLVISAISNYVYKFDKHGDLVLQESFPLFVQDFAETDWDVNLVYEDLIEKFPSLREYLISISPYNIFSIAPKELVEEIMPELLRFVRNNENRVYKGMCFKGKTIITSQGSVDKLFVEVIPKFGGKGLGVRFAQWIFGFSDRETIVSGDSLNDKDALKYGAKGVIVRNAEVSLLRWFEKRERKHVYVSELGFADAVIECIEECKEKNDVSTVFIYKKNDDGEILIDGRVVELGRFKEKWFVYSTSSLSFTVSVAEGSFTLPCHGRYAIYNSSLISISDNLKSIIFVTDLDNTIFNQTELGLQYYSNFINFWIKHFEFNGSFLIYNSGRDLIEFSKVIPLLFLGDLHHLCLGNFGYILDSHLNFVQDAGYSTLKSKESNHDWDSQILFQALMDQFEVAKEHLQVMFDTYFLLLVPKKIADDHIEDIKSFIKNKENKEFQGRVFKGKVRMISLGMEDQRYIEIIPLFLGKDKGVRYAQKKFSFEDVDTVVAGDSMNDKDALKLSVNGIIVKNCEESLLEWYKKKNREHLVISSEVWAYGLQVELEKKLSFIKN